MQFDVDFLFAFDNMTGWQFHVKIGNHVIHIKNA